MGLCGSKVNNLEPTPKSDEQHSQPHSQLTTSKDSMSFLILDTEASLTPMASDIDLSDETPFVVSGECEMAHDAMVTDQCSLDTSDDIDDDDEDDPLSDGLPLILESDDPSQSQSDSSSSECKLESDVRLDIDGTKLKFATCGMPRTIFCSIVALHQCWDDIDVNILANSIIVINGSRKAILPQSLDEYRCAREGTPIAKLSFTQPFFHFLACKDKQGLVIWLRDDLEGNGSGVVNIDDATNSSGALGSPTYASSGVTTPFSPIQRGSAMQASFRGSISEFPDIVDHTPKVNNAWLTFGKKLSMIIDTVTGDYYSNFFFSSQYWDRIHRFRNKSITAQKIQNEFSSASFKYKEIMAIVGAANPNLIPMIAFDNDAYTDALLRINNGSDNDALIISAVDITSQSAVDTTEYAIFGDVADADGFVFLEE